MTTLFHFFRLIRPLNLLVIGLTMSVFQYYLTNRTIESILELDFLLLVFSTFLIAAAGNIINDYFDVKADRVNKPEQLIIGKHLKRRWAILWNWVFNAAGIFIAAYLSWKYHVWSILFISFFTINVLWFYSAYFKRTFVLGNVLVALLTGIVPVYVIVFNLNNLQYDVSVVLVFAGYAFVLNLIREIVKDMADVKGDLKLHSNTLPIVLGLKATKFILFILFFACVASLGILLYLGFERVEQNATWIKMPALILLGAVIVTLFSSFMVLPNYLNRKRYLLSSNLLKLAMLFGLLIPLFL